MQDKDFQIKFNNLTAAIEVKYLKTGKIFKIYKDVFDNNKKAILNYIKKFNSLENFETVVKESEG